MTAPYLTLFFSAFLAATIVPAQSEGFLAAMIVANNHPVVALIAVASIGNILGSCVNWWLGTRIERYRDKKWFPASAQQLEKAQKWYHRYGAWSLLLSCLPIVGDPLTLIAGVMRERFSFFLILVSASKITRYILIAIAVDAF